MESQRGSATAQARSDVQITTGVRLTESVERRVPRRNASRRPVKSERMAEGEKREKKVAPTVLSDEPKTQRIHEWIAESRGETERYTEKEETQKGRRKTAVSGEGAGKETGRRGRPTKAESLKKERKNSVSSTHSAVSWLSSQSKRGRESDTDCSEEEGEKGKPSAKKEKKTIETKTLETRKSTDMEQVIEMMKGLTEKMESVKEELIKKMEKDKEELKKEMKTELERYKIEFEKRDQERSKEITDLRREIYEMKKREEDRERREKKRNIIIWGTQGREGEAKQVAIGVFKEINNNTEITEIREARFLGKNENRRILVEMETFEDKKRLMMGKKKLKGSLIYIDDDLTHAEREMQKNIRDWAKSVREKGNRAIVGYGKAYVNGKEVLWNAERKCMVERTFRREME